MLYFIRFAEYNKEDWHDEFIGYKFKNPDVNYALCIKDTEINADQLGINKTYYKANTWYSW